MGREFDILVVGELNADLVLRGDTAPSFDQVEKLIEDAVLTVGSSSAIFACAAARLGLRVAFVGKAGQDEFGNFLRRELEQCGDDTRGVVTDPQVKTGLSIILSRGNDRAIITYPGSISMLREDEVDMRLLARARHLHLGGYFLLDALRPSMPRLLTAARAQGLSTSLDTDYDPKEIWNGGLWDALAQVDIFLPNERELSSVAGTDDLDAALGRLSERIPDVAVKLGAEGAAAQRGSEKVRAAALAVQVADTTGAGDAFDGGFVYAYLAAWELERALAFACACGSLSTRAAGGLTAQPTLDEARRALSW